MLNEYKVIIRTDFIRRCLDFECPVDKFQFLKTQNRYSEFQANHTLFKIVIFTTFKHAHDEYNHIISMEYSTTISIYFTVFA